VVLPDLQMEQLANMEGSGLIPLLTDSKYEDLSRMYNLFKRVDGGLDLLRKMMGDHITAQALCSKPLSRYLLNPVTPKHVKSCRPDSVLA
jgi:hypothetical protein